MVFITVFPRVIKAQINSKLRSSIQMIILTAFDHFLPFLTIFESKISAVFGGRRPMHLRSNHDLNLWFSTVTLLWLIMRLLLSGIIEKRLSQKKTLVGFKHFFDKLLNWRIIWTKDIWETMVESVDICSEAGDPTFWLISIFDLGILKNFASFLVIFDQNSLFSSSKSDFGTSKIIFCYTTSVSVSTVNRPRMNSRISSPDLALCRQFWGEKSAFLQLRMKWLHEFFMRSHFLSIRSSSIILDQPIGQSMVVKSFFSKSISLSRTKSWFFDYFWPFSHHLRYLTVNLYSDLGYS